jgi:hypothetical protein
MPTSKKTQQLRRRVITPVSSEQALAGELVGRKQKAPERRMITRCLAAQKRLFN